MKRLVIGLLLTIAFLVGCLVATVASKSVIPEVKAGSESQKWEYQCKNLSEDAPNSKIDDELKQVGMQGWELVSATYVMRGNSFIKYCLKRQLH